MNHKIQDKKSNARIAWDEFISNFSLNDRKKEPVIPPSGKAFSKEAIEPELSAAKPSEKLTWNFNDYDELEAVSPVSVTLPVPPRTTVIGEKVVIDGNCKVEGDVEIYGEVQGDVDAGGSIGIYGRVTGNISGKSVLLNAAEVRGNVVAQGIVELDGMSTLTNGKLIAQNVISNGTTQCDMEISEIARFGASARATGNISTNRISIDEGAVIQSVIASK